MRGEEEEGEIDSDAATQAARASEVKTNRGDSIGGSEQAEAVVRENNTQNEQTC